MSRIVLAVDANRNRKLLYAFLSAYHSVAEHASGRPLDEPFDLCIVDGPSLRRFQSQLEARRDQEQPGILPVRIYDKVHYGKHGDVADLSMAYLAVLLVPATLSILLLGKRTPGRRTEPARDVT